METKEYRMTFAFIKERKYYIIEIDKPINQDLLSSIYDSIASYTEMFDDDIEIDTEKCVHDIMSCEKEIEKYSVIDISNTVNSSTSIDIGATENVFLI